MRKSTLMCCTALATLVTTQAFAQDFYVSGNLGFSAPNSTVFNDGTNGGGNPKVDIDDATRFGLAFGWMPTPNLRVELEYSKAKYGTDTSTQSGSGGRALDTFSTDADLDLQTVMLNVAYDFDLGTNLTPFVRAGVGRTFYDMDGGLFVSSSGGNTFGGFLPATFDYSGSGTNTSFQLGVGAAFDISDNSELLVEYRYSDYGRIATGYDANGDRLQTKLKSNEILIGYRYSFN